MKTLIELILSFFQTKQKIEVIQPVKLLETPPPLTKEEIKMPGKVKHINSGNCPKCEAIFNVYPNFHQGLKDWFKEIQKHSPEAHISCAGRGKIDQEEFFSKGTSKAHFGESSHGANCALDIFKLHLNMGAEWPMGWFTSVIEPAIDIHNETNPEFQIKWYGKKGSPFFELPHCEVENWRELLKAGKVKLVE